MITHYESKYLGLYERDNWVFAERPNAKGCVGILAITDADEIILVEQFRIPVQKRVIEVPAGLFGDETEFADETAAECAERELLEETGYRAEKITHLISSPTSAGMTPEITHLFHASGLTKETDGGGIDGEDITVHRVPMAELKLWLLEKEKQGFLVDSKIHASLWILSSIK